MTNEETRSRLTARRHRHELPCADPLDGQGITFLPGETDHDYQALREKYARVLAPVGDLETELASQIVLAQWRLLRYQNIEAVLLGSAGPALVDNYSTIPAKDLVTRQAFGFLVLARQSKALPILNRFLDRLGREYHAALQDFLLLRQGGRPRPATSKTSAGLRRQFCSVVAIDDPQLGRKPAQPSVRPPEPLTSPSEIAA